MTNRQWQPPRLRLFEDAHRRATWLELLYDLVFVVAVAELAAVLAEGADLGRVLTFVGLFVPVWWAWAGYVFYANRFDTDDVSHRLLALPQILAVATMAASVGDIEQRSALFAVSYAVARVLLIVAYVRAGRHVPEARALTTRYAAGFTVAVLIWLASLAVEPPQRYLFWAVALLIDLATPLLARRHQGKLPPQSEHLPERFGLFVVIVLGEVVAAVVIGLKGHDVTPGALLIALAGVAIAMGFWWLYFGHLDESVVLRTQMAGQVWVYSHLPLSLGLVAFGVGIEHAITHPSGTSGSVGVPAALVLAVLGVQHLCSRDRRAGAIRLTAAALTLAASLLPVVVALPVILLIAAAQVAYDLLRPLPEGAAT
ncbi:Low temperature requirement protein LtrA [Nonomuraea solani]|uniref:Low temperature requirement protein LtrA n=1 Tax=Nonomuraea solani TaxID=1144553 RepID=A0A1H6E5R1_9ACTN|nr:low temperature requirement protein A [Nonomuraea solani]SEG93040.1 Low temperature requirement protein LtrA [Nonomuraea solani]